MVFTTMILGKIRIDNPRELRFNEEDRIQNYYLKYKMVFPHAALNNRTSAHYIEINHIFFVEMMKKIKGELENIRIERESLTPKERKTRWITNPNYVYEPFGKRDAKYDKLE